ncbi:MAG: RNA pseudouridine synthase [Candidatus Omnitrophica bacterium]|nr:RNA pseudouridine synthase [Candidatus Omnitrophota bacterium]MDE2222473.1 RNA pseudouridine synthase [Candidatus Omnitrophota bacterium]
MNIPVLYEDGHCLVFNKPPGLLVVPSEKNERHTLESIVNEGRGKQEHLYPAHRIDRDTSGVILFAKGRECQERLMQAFKARQVHKAYVAFVHGHLKSPKGKIEIPIKDFFQRKFARHLPAQSALTYYEVQDYYKNFTVVKVMPVTGRTNQIRIHFAKIGHPLVGEDKYAFRRDFELRFRRTALHAMRLEWPKMEGKGRIAVEAPLAQDMEDFLEKHNK